MNFVFDPVSHIYTLDNRRLPTVSQIANSIAQVPQFAGEWHMNRGTQVHRALALYIAGRLDEASVDERIRGRVEAGKKAIRVLGLEPPYIIEKPLYHPTLLYAGTPDLGSAGWRLTDYKASHSPSTEIQLGGYIELLAANGITIKRATEVLLGDDGEFSIPTGCDYTRPADIRRLVGLFKCAFTVYQWREKHGLGN